MKCKYKLCAKNNDENFIVIGKQRFHEECAQHLSNIKQIKDLYNKYYNPNENWSIVSKTLYNSWLKKFDSEYILYCICMCIRSGKPLRNFLSLYQVLNDGKYDYNYKNKKHPQKLYGEKVLLTDEEYEKLLHIMGMSEIKVSYFIKKLDRYMCNTNKEYASHYETILDWFEKDDLKKPQESKIIIHSS